MNNETSLALEGLLRWYAAMGVDAVVDETPHDRFVTPSSVATPAIRTAIEPASARRLAPVREKTGSDAAAAVAADVSIRQAETLAASVSDLDSLRSAWESLPGCGLAATASRMIFAAGRLGSPLMVIGGAPESDDEREGNAFSGPHGRLLDAMLRAIGLDRDHVYLANVIPWRPPGNRVPTPLELALCLPFARRHIALADPAVVLCLGERAAQPMLDTSDPISRLRGRWLSYEGETKTVKTMVTFSPGYLLKQPLQKRRAWADLQMLAAGLGG